MRKSWAGGQETYEAEHPPTPQPSLRTLGRTECLGSIAPGAGHPWLGSEPLDSGVASGKLQPRSYRKMVTLLPHAPAMALRRWLGLGLSVLLCFSLGCALEKKVVKSKVGEKVGLPCCYEIPSSESLHNYRVYWQKNTTDVVTAYSEGKKMSDHIQFRQRYENRTEMDTRNLTLWISPVEILDNGSYQCVVQHSRHSQNSYVLCDERVTLIVTADFSDPNITAEVFANSCESAEMVVRCSSHGGFPKPKISGALNNMSVEWNASWVSKSSLSLYNVTGEVQLNVTKDTEFSCTIEYDGFTKFTSLLLKKTNDCVVPTVSPSYNVITASSIIIIVSLLAVTLAARYFPRHVQTTAMSQTYSDVGMSPAQENLCSHCCKPWDSVEEDVKECTKPMSSKVSSETSSV